MTASSMALQESVQFLGQLSANSFRGSDLLDACFAETIHGAKSPQQQIFPILAHTGAIVENAFFDSLSHQQLMIRIGKAMRLIANALK